MTSPPDRSRLVSEAGFTLLEVLAVLAVFALGLGLLALRGPARSERLTLQATADSLADGLRSARTLAIASNRAASVVIDGALRQWSGPGGVIHVIAPGIDVTLNRLGGAPMPSLIIAFAPDGSSSGGSVNLAAGPRRAQISASWLSGRVRVDGS